MAGQGGFAPGRRGEAFGRQANHHVLLAHGEGVERFRQENLKGSKIGIVVDIWNIICYNYVVDRADAALLKKEARKHTGGNFLDNGIEYYPKAIYDAIHILKEDYDLKIPIYATENGSYNCGEAGVAIQYVQSGSPIGDIDTELVVSLAE